MTDAFHEPVMVEEVVEFILTGPGLMIVDCTLGAGGHAEALLSSEPGPGHGFVEKLIGIDQDPEAIEAATKRLRRFRGRVVIKRRSFDELDKVLAEEGIEKVDAVLMDLGASRRQLTSGSRGFSLTAEGPLDMRMDPDAPESAADLLMRLSEKDLAKIIEEYGEERFAKRIAREITRRRNEGTPVRTTRELADLVSRVVPKGRRPKVHPATRTFMALRIKVNNELEKLAKALEIIPEHLAKGGRAVIVSYHSLEDRLVKQAFNKEEKGCVCPPRAPCACGKKPRLKVLTRKPVKPSPGEVAGNPAARSAKLRVAERVEDDP